MDSITMDLTTKSLSPQESRVVLALTEHRQRETTRGEIIRVLGGSPKAADHVIESLRRKGWLERATWGKYLLVPPDQGPDAIGDSNLLALASRIVRSVLHWLRHRRRAIRVDDATPQHHLPRHASAAARA